MQALYALENNYSQEEGFAEGRTTLPIEKCKALLNKEIGQSAALLTVLLTYLCKIAQYAIIDAQKRAVKYLVTAEDKNVNTKIADNILVSELWQNEAFQEARDKQKADSFVSEDWIKKLYRKLIVSDNYKKYIITPRHERKEDKVILTFIWEDVLLKNEAFLDDLPEEWTNWEGDRDLMKILIDNFLQKPGSLKFRQFISEEKQEYAEDLLTTVVEKNNFLLETIRKSLKNWETERIAQIDLVLLKMGLCEFLYFPTIPVKVTINEYIDIAKTYSTDQSGQFVNGILDNLYKVLSQQNEIRKIALPK